MANGRNHGEHAPAATQTPAPHDPEHDIDAKSTTIWFVGGALVLFIGLWLLIVVFHRVVEAERKEKVEDRPTTELNDVRENEMSFLNGANPTKKNIKTVVDGMRPK